MKRLILTISILLCAIVLAAQDYKVVSVEHLPRDMSARENIKTDENGKQCAVIRIATQNITPKQREGFLFSCDYSSYVVDRVLRNGEIWIWVSPGVKILKIIHNELGQRELQTSDYVSKVESLNTYRMILQGTMTNVSTTPAITQQYLAFQVSPPTATLEVNNQIWAIAADGTAMKFVDFGTYHYRVQAAGFHIEEGDVTVDDPVNTQIVTVTLLSNVGWIEVGGDGALQGANVYIDNKYVGKAPCKSGDLESGQHSLRIVKEMYATRNETVIVNDGQTTRVSPTLTADFAEVTLTVDADAEIWVNNEKKGVRTWKGALVSGTYRMECRQPDHETSVTVQVITANMNGQTIELPVPQIGYGSLNLESTPNFAEVMVDGVAMGTTPKSIAEIEAGNHEVTFSKEGYASQIETVVVHKGQRTQLKAQLKEVKKPAEPKHKEGNKEKPKVEKHKTDLSKYTFATLNGAYQPFAVGVSFGQVRRFGWYVTVMSNFGFKGLGAYATCNEEGFLEDGTTPVFTGETAYDRHSIVAGGVMHVAGSVFVRLGVGYGINYLSWETDDGSYCRNSAYSVSGLDLSGGLQLMLGRMVVTAEVAATGFRYMEGRIGVGISF